MAFYDRQGVLKQFLKFLNGEKMAHLVEPTKSERKVRKVARGFFVEIKESFWLAMELNKIRQGLLNIIAVSGSYLPLCTPRIGPIGKAGIFSRKGCETTQIQKKLPPPFQPSHPPCIPNTESLKNFANPQASSIKYPASSAYD
jgi:hypothetical protein